MEGWMNTMTIEYLINKYDKNKFAIEFKSAIYKKAIDDLLNNLKIIKEEYQSKYNSYVVYDYEPSSIAGFKYYAEFETSRRYIDFIKGKIKAQEKRLRQHK